MAITCWILEKFASMFFINSVSILGYVAHEGKETCSLIVMSCSICSIWSYGGAVVSSPGTTISFGSAAGSHRGVFWSIGLSSVDMDGVMLEGTRQDASTRRVSRRQGTSDHLNSLNADTWFRSMNVYKVTLSRTQQVPGGSNTDKRSNALSASTCVVPTLSVCHWRC